MQGGSSETQDLLGFPTVGKWILGSSIANALFVLSMHEILQLFTLGCDAV